MRPLALALVLLWPTPPDRAGPCVGDVYEAWACVRVTVRAVAADGRVTVEGSEYDGGWVAWWRVEDFRDYRLVSRRGAR